MLSQLVRVIDIQITASEKVGVNLLREAQFHREELDLYVLWDIEVTEVESFRQVLFLKKWRKIYPF